MAKEGKVLGDRGRALEDEFFRRQEAADAAERKLKQLTETAKADIAAASGIQDAAVLDKLVELGIGAETLAAITLVPLVEIAWADGSMDPPEREAILRGAQEQGLEAGSAPRALLEDWLDHRPPPRLLAAWREYIGTLCEEMLPEQRNALKRDVLDRARRVAEAAGGFLGMGNKVSKEEEQVYKVLETAFRD